MKRIEIFENGIYLTFELEERRIGLVHLSPFPYHEGSSETIADIALLPSARELVFGSLSDTADELGRRLVITQTDDTSGVTYVTHFRFFTGIPVVRVWTETTDRSELAQKHDPLLPEGGVHIDFIGTPDVPAAVFYQPEENSGMSAAVVGAVKANGGFSAYDNAAAALTRFRRTVRRRTPDLRRLPVIFRGGAEGSPEDGYPLIAAAAEIGCELYCIDTDSSADGTEAVTGYIRSKGMIAGRCHGLESLSDIGGLIAICPEESAVECRLSADQSAEETVFCMVSAMLTRIELCGELLSVNSENRRLITEALAVYRKLRKDIPRAVPFFPTGVIHPEDEWASFGLVADSCAYLAVQRRSRLHDTLTVPLGFIKGRSASAECIYPSFSQEHFELDAMTGVLRVTFGREHTARLFKLRFEPTL